MPPYFNNALILCLYKHEVLISDKVMQGIRRIPSEFDDFSLVVYIFVMKCFYF